MIKLAATPGQPPTKYNLPSITTLAAAKATLHAIKALKEGKLAVKSLQEYHEMVGRS